MEWLGALKEKQILVRRGADENPARTQAVKYTVKESLRMGKMLNRFKGHDNVECGAPMRRKLLGIPANKLCLGILHPAVAHGLRVNFEAGNSGSHRPQVIRSIAQTRSNVQNPLVPAKRSGEYIARCVLLEKCRRRDTRHNALPGILGQILDLFE